MAEKSKVIGIMLKHADGDKEYYEPELSNEDVEAIFKILEKYGDDNESIRGDLEVIDVVFDQLEKLVGRRYANLELLKNDIEVLTGKRVNAISESESERFEDTDFIIDYEFEEFDIHSLWYLKDNAGNYYITEV